MKKFFKFEVEEEEMKAGIQAVSDETRRDAAVAVALFSCMHHITAHCLSFCSLDLQAARGRQGAAPDSPLSVPR